MEFDSEKEITYQNIFEVIQESTNPSAPIQQVQGGSLGASKFLYTIEFYPEEGKYHYDGHRDCNFVCSPEETKKLKGICPKCKKPLVIGVDNRVVELADRSVEEALRQAQGKLGRVPFKSLVPLPEIIADVLDIGVSSKKVQAEYNNLIAKLGSEFNILLNVEIEEIKKASQNIIGEAVKRVRKGKIYVQPGYDGEFGVVKVFSDQEREGNKQIGFTL